MVLSGNLCRCLKEANQLLLFDRDTGIILDPVWGIQATLRVDLGYMVHFIFAVNSGSLYTCDSVLGDSV